MLGLLALAFAAVAGSTDGLAESGQQATARHHARHELINLRCDGMPCGDNERQDQPAAAAIVDGAVPPKISWQLRCTCGRGGGDHQQDDHQMCCRSAGGPAEFRVRVWRSAAGPGARAGGGSVTDSEPLLHDSGRRAVPTTTDALSHTLHALALDADTAYAFEVSIWSGDRADRALAGEEDDGRPTDTATGRFQTGLLAPVDWAGAEWLSGFTLGRADFTTKASIAVVSLHRY